MLNIDKKFGKYANPEVERKFLLRDVPSGAALHSEISDVYIDNTTLRLRKAKTAEETRYKLGQKLRVDPNSTRVILHTNIYLTESEFGLLKTLPGKTLVKKRYKFDLGGTSVWVDQFQDDLIGLVVLEVDFGATGDPTVFPMPDFAVAEVTDDERFTGAKLAMTDSASLKVLLSMVR